MSFCVRDTEQTIFNGVCDVKSHMVFKLSHFPLLIIPFYNLLIYFTFYLIAVFSHSKYMKEIIKLSFVKHSHANSHL